MVEVEDLKDTAYRAIGEGDSDSDWKIVPSEHAARFADVAPSLAEVLHGVRPEGLARMYQELNSEAVEARDVFKAKVSRANAAIFTTASLGALLLVAGGLQEFLDELGQWVVGATGLLGAISSGLAAMWLGQVKGGSLSRNWVDERAKAEAKRLAYFKAIMEGASENALDQLFALEYVRRFLLDNQIDYFRERGHEHGQAARDALERSTRAVFAASTFTAVAGLLSMRFPQLAVIAGLGVVASAYATLAGARSAVNLDRTNADRYRIAHEQLLERRLDLDDYRKRVASGAVGAVQEFFEPVFITLEAEHKAFLSDAEQRELAIGNMEKRLDAAQEALKKKPQTKTAAG